MPARRREGPIRVLVIPDKYLPDQCAGGAIYSDMCRGLVDRGLDVTVRCPYPFYPEWTDKSGNNGLKVARSVEEGVKVERFGFFIPRDPKAAWQRIALDLSFFASLSRSLVGGPRFDAVIALCPHTGGVAFAALYKMLFGAPLCLSVMDLPADAARNSGITRPGLFQKALQRVQKVMFNRADVWRSISPVMIDRLKELRVRDQPILFIPDWLHPSISDELRRLPSKVGRAPGKPVRLFYSGNIGTKQGLLDFCQALHSSDAAFDFRIHGEGGMAAPVRDWIASCGDARFTFGGLVDEPVFVRALHDADLYVVTEKSTKGAAFFPSKTIPGMASGTPILAVSSPDSPLGCEVRNQQLGPCFSWEECGSVGALLSSLDTKGVEFAAWQKNSLRRGQFYDREHWLDLFAETVQDMTEDRGLARTRLAAVAS